MSRGVKLVILDECDSMTSAAQFALRRIVEKYSKTTRFCLICNYVAKIIPALQSRCTRFRFGPLADQAVSVKLAEVCKSEQIQLADDAAAALVRLAGGDMRKVLNILESCSLAYRDISTRTIYEVTGRPSPAAIERIYNSLTTEDFKGAYDTLLDLKTTQSLALDDIIRELHKCIMDTDFNEHMKMFLIGRLSEVEFRLSHGANEKAQMASVVGSFIEVRTLRG